MDDRKIDDALGQVDGSRRAALVSMVTKAAFVAPVVATFAMGGLSVREAHAYGIAINPNGPLTF